MLGDNPFDDLEFFIRDKVILNTDSDYAAVTVWIAFAMSISEFDYSPRLSIWSPEKRCGKSTLLDLIHNLLPDSKLTSNISAAALFRTIEKDESSAILIDEADTIFGRYSDKEKAEALRGIGNSGFKRGAEVIRCEGSNFEPKSFKVFCPVVFAGIGTEAIPETIADRSIVIEMRRKLANEVVSEYESDEIEEVFAEVRTRMQKWILENRQNFRPTRPEFPTELNARARDVWKPIFKIAENINDEWRRKIYNAAIALSTKPESPDDVSLALRLLTDCREVLDRDLPTKELILRLKGLEESPWGYMDGFNASLLARLLKNYGITSKHWSSYRGYTLSSFRDAWRRYLPQETVMPVSPVIKSDAYDAYDALPLGSQKSSQNYAQASQ